FALLDVGGGSTELLVANGARVLIAVSLRLGVVQLAEQFFVGDPIVPAELAACRAYVDARLRDELWPRMPATRPLTLVAPARQPPSPAALPLAARARPRPSEPGRAAVIVPVAVVLAAALAGLGLPAALVSDAGLREGILLDAVGWRPCPGHHPPASQ